MDIFVTGGTGFIGRRVVPSLVEHGHHVCCLVRSSGKAAEVRALGAVPTLGDVTDPSAVTAGMTGCDAAIHLANVYSFWEPDKTVYERVNVGGDRVVFEAALSVGLSKVVHVSTAATFGRTSDQPFTEESTRGPRASAYAESKYRGDQIAATLEKTRGLPLVIIYPAPVVGAGDPKPTGQLIGDAARCRLPAVVCPETRMTFVYVGDVAKAIARALEKPDDLGQRYLIGKYSLTIREAIAMVCAQAGVTPPRMSLPAPVARAAAVCLTAWADASKRPPKWGLCADMVRTMDAGVFFDGSKAERELGLSYTPLETAVGETIEAMRDA